MLCATQLSPNQPNNYSTASPVRARERQIRAPKKHVIWGLRRGSYSDRVTVYPYNGYIRSTNPIVRHVMSLTWTVERMLANSHTLYHAATQPLHGLGVAKSHILLNGQYWPASANRCTNSLILGIYRHGI